MKIELTVRDGEPYDVLVNGRLVFRGLGGGGEDCDQLQERLRGWNGELQRMHLIRAAVERARTIINREDHNYPTPEKKRDAYCRGLLAGLLGETVQHPLPGVPPIPPENTPSFTTGFEWGLSMREAAKATDL